MMEIRKTTRGDLVKRLAKLAAASLLTNWETTAGERIVSERRTNGGDERPTEQ
jgi:hypothetical protein